MNAKLTALVALVRKDIVLFFSNKRSLVITLAAPIAVAAFFGSLFAPGSDKLSKVPIAVIDLDRSTLSQKIVSALSADAALAVTPFSDADAVADAGVAKHGQGQAVTQAMTLVQNGKLRAAIVLPVGFGAEATAALFGSIDERKKPQVDIHYDPSQSMVLGLVRGILAQHVMQAVSQSAFSVNSPAVARLREEMQKATDGDANKISPDLKRDLSAMFDSIAKVQAARASSAGKGTTAAAPGFSMPFTTNATEVTSGIDKKYNSYAQSFAGMSVQFILFMGVDFGVGLLLARRMGLWKRLRAAPISTRLLLGSSIASCTLIAAIVMSIIYAAALAFFKVRLEGSIIGFMGVMWAFGFLTATFGLLIAAIGKTPEATRGLAIFATLLMVMLGGAWVPSFVFPEWLQTVSLGVPTRWAIDGLTAMTWRGLGLEAALAPIGVMLAFSAVFAMIAIWRFDWEE